MSKFEFCKRRNLWTHISQFRYVSVPAMGKNLDRSKDIRSFTAVDGLESSAGN